MRRAPTLADVATRAGVSYATVDRVLNGRGAVAEKSRASVLKAVAELDYVRNVAAANLAQRRVYRFCFVIPEGTNAFFDRVCAIVDEAGTAARTDRIKIGVKRVPAFDPDALAGGLRSLADEALDGVVVVGVDGAGVSEAIAALCDRGIAVLTMISDLPAASRSAYVGIDNATAGRTAGGLIVLAHGRGPGRVLPIVGALSARDHADRLDGLRQTLAPTALTVAPLIEGLDRHDVVEARLRAALAADPEITAIYSAGAGNAGLIRVIAHLPADRPRPVVVLHELLPHNRRALEDGLIDIVIDQRPEEEVARVLTLLRNLADRCPLPEAGPIVPAIYIRENLPARDTSDLLKGNAA